MEEGKREDEIGIDHNSGNMGCMHKFNHRIVISGFVTRRRGVILLPRICCLTSERI